MAVSKKSLVKSSSTSKPAIKAGKSVKNPTASTKMVTAMRVSKAAPTRLARRVTV